MTSSPQDPRHLARAELVVLTRPEERLTVTTGAVGDWLVLTTDEPVVTTRSVPTERVCLVASWATAEQQIQVELAHEEISTVDDPTCRVPPRGDARALALPAVPRAQLPLAQLSAPTGEVREHHRMGAGREDDTTEVPVLDAAVGARDVGATVSGGIAPPDHPDDPDLPENRGGRPAEHAPGVQSLDAREPLTRERIVTAAIDFIDTHGLPALTMRRLGQRLGVEAMAFYRHIPSRDDLLDAVVEHVVDELYADADVYLEPRHGWQDYLNRLAHGVRRIALAHPALFPLVVTRPPAAPWVRPPLRSLKWVASFLEALRTHGFTREQAVVAYRAYTSFLLGHLLLEVAQRGVAINAVDDPDGAPDHDQLDVGTEFPVLVDLQDLLSLDETVTEFEESLDSLIARLGTMLTTHAGHL